MRLPWLENDPAKPAKLDYDDGERDRQWVLFAGMDCLPDQLDLFETDGEEQIEPCTP